MVFCHFPYGPFSFVDARIRCPSYRFPLSAMYFFSGLYLAARSALDLSFLGVVSLPRCGCLYRREVFRNGVALCPVQRSFWFTSVSQWGVYCIK